MVKEINLVEITALFALMKTAKLRRFCLVNARNTAPHVDLVF